MQGLQRLGWTDGHNVRIDTRWGTGDADAFGNTQRNWPRSRRTSSWPVAAQPWQPLLQATRTVPIVFMIVPDPVGAGFVDSLARPGGNATGFMHVRIRLEREMAGTAQSRSRRASRERRSFGMPPYLPGSASSAHPVRGAVARGGGERGQCARRERDRARRRRLRARAEWRPDRDGERVGGKFIAI